jgi:hypothetical protein
MNDDGEIIEGKFKNGEISNGQIRIVVNRISLTSVDRWGIL